MWSCSPTVSQTNYALVVDTGSRASQKSSIKKNPKYNKSFSCCLQRNHFRNRGPLWKTRWWNKRDGNSGPRHEEFCRAAASGISHSVCSNPLSFARNCFFCDLYLRKQHYLCCFWVPSCLLEVSLGEQPEYRSDSKCMDWLRKTLVQADIRALRESRTVRKWSWNCVNVTNLKKHCEQKSLCGFCGCVSTDESCSPVSENFQRVSFNTDSV